MNTLVEEALALLQHNNKASPIRWLIFAAICWHRETLTALGIAFPNMMTKYGKVYLKSKTKQGVQTNLALTGEADADWLPKCEIA